MESKPSLTKIFTVTEKRACVKLQLKLHPCINSRSSEMGKTAMQIIPAGKMCSLQRSNSEIMGILGKKTPNTKNPKLYYSNVSLMTPISLLLSQIQPDF